MAKLIRITTVPMALRYLLPGQMRYMQAHGFDVLMVSANGPELPDVLAHEGCAHQIVPLTRQITPLKDLACLWAMFKLLRRERPDIVHTHTPKAGLIGMLAAKLAGVRIRIHTVAGMPLMVEKGAKYHLLKYIERLTYWAATQVWPNSQSLKGFIQQHQLAHTRKLRIIGRGSSNGINLERFNPAAIEAAVLEQTKQAIDWQPDKRYMLCVGRLVKDKGITELVAAFVELQRTAPEWQLVLVGQYEPELDPLPTATLQQIQTHPAIKAVGWSTQVPAFMQLAHLFVFPSHREGFPNVLLQAGAMQLPIICSPIPGNVDIVRDGETGRWFATGNPTALLAQMQAAIQSPGQMRKMAESLYQEVQQYYQQQNVWAAIRAEYVSLLNDGTR
jgi:glycosyltransferase involved in cell wall biosynthesis